MSAPVAVGDRDPISARAHHRGDWLCAKQEPGGLLTAQGFGRCSRPRGHQEPQHVVWSAETGRVLAVWASRPMTELSTEEAAVVQRFEAGADAEESLRSRVIEAIAWADSDEGDFPPYDVMADAAIAVMRGDS